MGLSGELPTLHNLAPSEFLPVIRYAGEAFAMDTMRWWLHPSWSPDPPNSQYSMFNARIETLATSRAFKIPFQRQRAIIPVSGFVEWKAEGKNKIPYFVDCVDSPMLLAGIWDNWRDEVFSCAIVTQPASESFKNIHDRMPLSLSEIEAAEWLDPSAKPSDLLQSFEGKSLSLRCREVLPTINNARKKLEVEFV